MILKILQLDLCGTSAVVLLREKVLAWLYKLMMLFLNVYCLMFAVYVLPSFMMHSADSGVEAAARDRV